MQVIITYDVSRRQTDVKRALKARGFLDYWVTNNVTYYLPDTTLWHQNLLDSQAAINIFNEVIIALNANQPPTNVIIVRRVIAFPLVAGWSGRPGEAHAE